MTVRPTEGRNGGRGANDLDQNPDIEHNIKVQPFDYFVTRIVNILKKEIHNNRLMNRRHLWN